MQKIDIESLIPHRARIKMIDTVVSIEAQTAVAEATVKSGWPLCDGVMVDPVVLIEVVAQTAAVIDGYKRRTQGKSGGKGWLVGVKNAEFKVDLIPVGTRLLITVKNTYSFDSYSVIRGSIKAGEEVLATIVLQAVRMNEDPTKD